jgi:hypothetical protein
VSKLRVGGWGFLLRPACLLNARKIVELGLPGRHWVEAAANRRGGLGMSYEEYRNLIDVPFGE